MRHTSRRVRPMASSSSASCLTGTSCIPHDRGDERHFLCPGSDSNRHCMGFESMASAVGLPGLGSHNMWCWLASATVTTTRRRVLVAEDEALIRLDLKE